MKDVAYYLHVGKRQLGDCFWTFLLIFRKINTKSRADIGKPRDAAVIVSSIQSVAYRQLFVLLDTLAAFDMVAKIDYNKEVNKFYKVSK